MAEKSKSNLKSLKDLVAQNKTQQVFKELPNYVTPLKDQQHKNTMVLLSNRWKKLRTDKINDVISERAYQQENNRINQSLLEWLDEMNLDAALVADTPSAKSIPWKKILTTFGATIALLAGIAEVTGYSLRDLFAAKEPTEVVSEPANSVTSNIADTVKTLIPIPKKPVKKVVTPPVDKPAEQKKAGSTSKVLEEPLPEKKASFHLDIKTNKGANNLVFQESEELRLFFQVNRPCLLRTIYKLADGSLILLDDDREVNTPETKKWVELGDGFEVAPPFGTEELYVFAQEKPFPKLVVEKIDGYAYIKEGLPNALRKTRGLKKKNNLLEKKLQLTTKK